jgi:hypothetical protein
MLPRKKDKKKNCFIGLRKGLGRQMEIGGLKFIGAFEITDREFLNKKKGKGLNGRQLGKF